MMYVYYILIGLGLVIVCAGTNVLLHMARVLVADLRVSRVRYQLEEYTIVQGVRTLQAQAAPGVQTQVPVRESLRVRFGRWLYRRVGTNNRRARTLMVAGLLVTLVAAFFLAHVLITFQPTVAANDSVPDMGRSSIHTGYLPPADAFYGYSKDSGTSVPSSLPATPWGWVIFWLAWWFGAMPVMWFAIIVYAFLSMREEKWAALQGWFASMRVGLTNMRERGESKGDASTVNVGTVIRWPEPAIVGVASGAAAVKTESMWDKILNFAKSHSGELVGLMFVLEELIEKRKRKVSV